MTFNQSTIERRFAIESAKVLEGVVEGYASVFDVIDSHGTKIAKGAFDKSLREWRDLPRRVPMYLNHYESSLIGYWTDLEEDEKGLKVKGKLLSSRREDISELFEGGALSGMSIGFYPMTWEGGERMAYTFTEVKLIEVSLVVNPSNAAAEIEHVRSGMELPKTIREFEALLRSFGYSAGQAKGIASKGFKADHRDGAPENLEPDHRDDAGVNEALLTGLQTQLLLMRLQNGKRKTNL